MNFDAKSGIRPWHGFRVWVAYGLWLLGLRRILPRSVVNRVPVVECGEPFVLVHKSLRLRLRDGSGIPVRLREGVAKRLYAAAELLPAGFNLILVEGYRSVARQEILWKAELEAMKRAHSGVEKSEVERLVRLRVANPALGGGGHQTGGAVDVTLADTDWRELDMGTAVYAFSVGTPTHSRAVSLAVRKRRRELCLVMHLAGFVNYPGEWWHFSYGDKLWAAYGRKPSASMGPLVESGEKVKFASMGLLAGRE